MKTYWLTPVSATEPLTLASPRIALSPEEGDALRRLSAEAHPRLLPSFKLALLLGEDGEACGTGADVAELRLDEGGAVVLTGPLAASSCAVAFAERLLAPDEALRLAEKLAPHAPHADALRAWWSSGLRAMLIKEE
ncbi:hypothetical protein [Paenibacillus sp.]|uniref:hypothetical protein n=1 Tax=Paenibacillus sp. TaxID=58172 RepID=UPI002D413B36|nr:hypothetical protein [Paenibacillus sp.]HZG88292.1 hypothetical protein [Paenibacillus sp.]